jgi:hypothetical protein
MIVVYADETGTHGLKKGGKEPAPGVYGFMATPKEWEEFRVKWKTKLEQYGAQYFHFKEVNQAGRHNPKSPFHGWSDDRADDFIHDMAIVASSGPVPFGGYVSIKALYGGRIDKKAHHGSYAKGFEQFFDDFSSMMDRNFPNQKSKTSFFFDDNENDDWISILNSEIKKARRKDHRIGKFSFTDAKSEWGIPCQAADLLAYVNRQQAETAYERGYHQQTRLLDFIISRHGFPKDNPRSMYASYTDAEWETLINMLRADKKLKYTRDVARGLQRQQYYPFQHNELLKRHMAQWVAQYPHIFNYR